MNGEDDQGCSGDKHWYGQRNEEVERCANPAEIRSGFDDVAKEGQADHGQQHPARELVADAGEEPLAIDLSDLGRQINNDIHHRQEDRRDP